MTLSDEILKLQTNLADSYTACSSKGATMPANRNFDNLPDCIDSIQASTPAVITSLTVTPSTTQQVITAPSGTDGYNPITVDAVTSSIDSNIVAGNIKDGVTILGVTGNYTGGGSSGVGIPREVSSSGVYTVPINNFTFNLPSNATNVGNYALYYALYTCTSLTSVDLSSLTTISGSNALDSAFRSCTSLTSVDLSSLVTLTGASAFISAFRSCTNLTSVDLSSLTTISGSSALSNTFDGCTNLTSVDLSSLTTISGSSALSNTFIGCSSLASVDLSGLTTISGDSCLYYTFRRCVNLTSLSFASLTSMAFGSKTNQFNDMLKNVSNCTVHFPSNLQSVIGSWTSVTNGFGGTNTTVLFDLPATT